MQGSAGCSPALGAEPQDSQIPPHHRGTLTLFAVGIPSLESVGCLQWGWGKGAVCAAGQTSDTGSTIENVSLLKRNKLLMEMQFPAVRNSKDSFQTGMNLEEYRCSQATYFFFFFPPKNQLNKIPRKAHLYPFNYLINSSAFKAPPHPHSSKAWCSTDLWISRGQQRILVGKRYRS